jgi:hypothetical protein
VIKTKWIAGVSGIGTGKRYRTRQDRLKDLLQCPSETASYDMSCVYRGSGLKAPFSDEMILLYDKPENHNSLSVRNVILYKTNPSVKRIPEEEFKELIAKDNKNRIQMGIKEELEVID